MWWRTDTELASAGLHRGALLESAMIADMSEHLLTHYVTGRWRAPLATGAVAVRAADGQILGHVIAAGAADLARAQAGLARCDSAGLRRVADALDAGAEALAQAWAVQTGTALDPDALVQAIARPNTVSGGLLQGDRAAPELGAALGSGLRGGLIWCPPPGQALFATVLAQQVAQADIKPGAFNLLHTRDQI